jgi:adenosylcobinamide kinase/adenosylcobinamide-phosphate guanylyltransferase
MKHLTLILGGRNSGKSIYALEHGGKTAIAPVRKYLLATAQALDEKMAERIETSKKERPSEWTTIEEAIKVPDVIGFLHNRADVLVIDSLSLWLSNLLILRHDYDIEKEADLFLAMIKRVDYSIIVVSTEIGCGIVPPDSTSQLFCDTLGPLHQKLAALSNDLYFMVAGRPLQVG